MNCAVAPCACRCVHARPTCEGSGRGRQQRQQPQQQRRQLPTCRHIIRRVAAQLKGGVGEACGERAGLEGSMCGRQRGATQGS